MDPSLGGMIAVALGAIMMVVLWVRTRAFETLVAEESAVMLAATSSAIDGLDERLTPNEGKEPRRRNRRRHKRGRKSDRKGS